MTLQHSAQSIQREGYSKGFKQGVKYSSYALNILLDGMKIELLRRDDTLEGKPIRKLVQIEKRVQEGYARCNRLYSKSAMFLERAESEGASVRTRRKNLNRTMQDYLEIHSDVTYLLANLIPEKKLRPRAK